MSITKLPDGRWKVDVEPVRGRRFRKTLKTQAEAKRFEATCRAKVIQENDWTPRNRDARRLSDLIGLWFDLHGHNLRDGKRRRTALEAFSQRLGNPVASTLDASLYAHDRRTRSLKGIKPKTLNNELTYIRAVYNELRGLGQITYENPLALVKPIKIQEQELAWLTHEQIQELLGIIRSRSASVTNPHLELIVLICLATGARWSEAENLKPSSIRNGAVTFSNTKSGKVRTVPVDQKLLDKLQEHWNRYGPFTYTLSAFRRALHSTSIQLPKGQASHVLRHTFASHFMMNGGNILTLQKILGHSTVTVTMRYAHLSPDHLQDAIHYSPLGSAAWV
ncbi:MAG: tyrosine-type recombinase/integrase [Oceanospirillales bacterium]|nr:tyrosine-type recombinase/integrase [Oceanospirillales bacterium]